MTVKHIEQMFKKWNLRLGDQIQFEEHLIRYQNSEKSTVTASSSTYEYLNIENEDDFQNPGPSKKSKEKYIDIKQILLKSSQCRLILNLYSKCQNLNNGSRNILVETIINHMIQNDMKMSIEIAKTIGLEIIKLFPSECIDYFYTKIGGKKPQGKIYDKYFNTLRHLKNSGVLPKRNYSRNFDDVKERRSFTIGPPEKDIAKNIEAIINDNCTWDEIELHWIATKNFRVSQFQETKLTEEILENWKQYRKPLGYKLIDIDFKCMYPAAGNIKGFPEFYRKILVIFESKIKDPASKQLFEQLKNENYNSESKYKQ